VLVGRDVEAAALARMLTAPGLAVLAGPPGIGKSALATHAVELAGLAVARTGGLATLRHRPGLPLTRAARAPIPLDDVPLAVEAVRARLRGRILLIDDLHWADGYTQAVVLALAPYCRVVATIRTPWSGAAPVRAAAGWWLDLPALPAPAATELVRSVAPGLAPADTDAVVTRAGGNPLAALTLAGRPGLALPPGDPVAYGVASMIAELPLDQRTALAALGLLGRPALAALLGPGVDGLLASGLLLAATPTAGRPTDDKPAGDRPTDDRPTADGPTDDGPTGDGPTVDRPTGEGPTGDGAAAGAEVRAREPYVAEVAAGVLPVEARQAMHARLGALLPDPGEAARHLLAAGDPAGAVARALAAASTAGTAGARAEHLLLALRSAGAETGPELPLAAAGAALAVGWAAEAARILTDLPAEPPAGPAWSPLDPGTGPGGWRVRRAVLSARALLATGAPGAMELLQGSAAELPGMPVALRGAHAEALVRAALADDPDVACAFADYTLADLGTDAPAGLAAAHAEALRAAGRPGWATALRSALATAQKAGDLAGECAAGAALVAGLADSCRTRAARELAGELADRCAAEQAYSAEVGFRAAALWADLHLHGVTDELIQAATGLSDRAAPADARVWLIATLGLAQADAGAIPAAWSALRPGPASRTLRWVQAETAWLDGGRDRARGLAGPLTGDAADLPAELATLTLAWCAADEGQPGAVEPFWSDRAPVQATMAAWAAGDAAAFRQAADGWAAAMVREQVRCLLAAGMVGDVAALLEAERLAESAGLAVLLGRARRALRPHGIVRRSSPQAGGGLSPREREVLALVGRGLSTRRIAELLGITRHTTETYVKSGMSRLGARTRTEAAVLAARPEPAPELAPETARSEVVVPGRAEV
jgi:DNA-binding CsgD family transcriptional regulator